MKFRISYLPPCLLLFIAVPLVHMEVRNIETYGNLHSGKFVKKVQSILKDENERFNIMRDHFEKFGIVLDQTNVLPDRKDMITALNNASDAYGKLSRTISGTCAISGQTKSLSELDESTEEFYKTSKQVLKNQVGSLRTIVNRIANSDGYIGQLKDNLFRAQGSALTLDYKLGRWIEAKRRSLSREILETAVQEDKKRLEEIENLHEDSKKYINWVYRPVLDLKSWFNDDKKVFDALTEIINKNKSIFEKGENLLYRHLEKHDIKNIISISSRINSVVKEISLECKNV